MPLSPRTHAQCVQGSILFPLREKDHVDDSCAKRKREKKTTPKIIRSRGKKTTTTPNQKPYPQSSEARSQHCYSGIFSLDRVLKKSTFLPDPIEAGELLCVILQPASLFFLSHFDLLGDKVFFHCLTGFELSTLLPQLSRATMTVCATMPGLRLTFTLDIISRAFRLIF